MVRKVVTAKELQVGDYFIVKDESSTQVKFTYSPVILDVCHKEGKVIVTFSRDQGYRTYNEDDTFTVMRIR